MPKDTGTKSTKFETVEPLGDRVLIRKDEDKKRTKGGIELPDSVEIPTITGRIVTVSAQIANDDDFPIRQYDKVLFNPKPTRSPSISKLTTSCSLYPLKTWWPYSVKAREQESKRTDAI